MLTVHDDPFRPQPRLDRDADGGMTTRRPPAPGRSGRTVSASCVSHNTKFGAAKGAVLLAEALRRDGYL
jgi:aspartate-semialdehyde dehydrogenase